MHAPTCMVSPPLPIQPPLCPRLSLVLPGSRRQHPSVKLQRIPSLFRWAGKRPSNALVEGQCMVGKDVLELINADE